MLFTVGRRCERRGAIAGKLARREARLLGRLVGRGRAVVALRRGRVAERRRRLGRRALLKLGARLRHHGGVIDLVVGRGDGRRRVALLHFRVVVVLEVILGGLRLARPLAEQVLLVVLEVHLERLARLEEEAAVLAVVARRRRVRCRCDGRVVSHAPSQLKTTKQQKTRVRVGARLHGAVERTQQGARARGGRRGRRGMLAACALFNERSARPLGAPANCRLPDAGARFPRRRG